jgi:integrase
MAVLRLDYVTRDRDRHGNVRYYFRRPGKKKLRLRGQPGSEEFMAAYAAALAGEKVEAEPKNKSLDWLCDRYFKSATFLALEDYTKRRKRTVLNEICDITLGEGKAARRLGTLPFEGMSKAHVRKLRDMRADAPEAANFRLKQISALFSWAVKEEHAKVNPAEGVERIANASEGFYTWTEQDVLAFERHHPIGTKPRLAMALLLWLGVRRSDVILLGPSHVGDGLISFVQFKGRKKSQRIITLPILPPLQHVLDRTPLGRETYLETAYGKAFTAPGFGNWFRTQCDAAGLKKCSAHGLRKIGAVRAAENGASEHELMALFGWENAEMARIYTRKAAQKRMAVSAAAKMSKGIIPGDLRVPPSVPLEIKVMKNNDLKRRWCPEEDSNLHALQR